MFPEFERVQKLVIVDRGDRYSNWDALTLLALDAVKTPSNWTTSISHKFIEVIEKWLHASFFE